MTDRTLTNIKFWFAIGGAIAAITMAWSNLSSQVQQIETLKADASEVEALRQIMQRVDDRTARIERFLCQGRTTDLGCQR